MFDWKVYRLDRYLIENACELVKGDLERPTKRNKAVSVSSREKIGFRAMNFR